MVQKGKIARKTGGETPLRGDPSKHPDKTPESSITGAKSEMLDAVESKSLRKKIPHFEIGDTVDVRCSIREGDKVRTQVFTGIVIARRGRGINETFTVRRIVDNEGVERIFPLHSPNVVDVKPIRSGKARRAKLYYLRQRTGKAVRLAHRHSDHTGSK